MALLTVWKSCLWSVVFCLVYLCSLAGALADYNVYQLLTIEWLVDNSDVITIVRGQGAEREVIQSLKGDSNLLSDKLKNVQFSGNSVQSPPADGSVRILFIQREATLLQEVSLTRKLGTCADLDIQRLWFGVTQHGTLLFNAADLLDAVKQRIQLGKGHPLRPEASNERAGKNSLLVEAEINFPFESTDEMFLLLVPNTAEWRDYYLKKLESGDASQRIEAIRKLIKIGDEPSLEAIRDATAVKSVPRGYQRVWSGSESPEIVTAKDVRETAKLSLSQFK